MNTRPLVVVIDDDVSIRESLPDLVTELGFAAETFASAEAFLASPLIDEAKCLILDIALQGMPGPTLQQELKIREKRIPIVFITAIRDEGVRERLIAQGAVECLKKPFSDTALLDALNAALRPQGPGKVLPGGGRRNKSKPSEHS